MLSFFTGSGIWLALGGVFLLFLVIANVPRPNAESIPWLFMALASFTIAYLPIGSTRKAWDFALAHLWDDHVMRWHFIVALVLSVVGPFLTLGLSGFVPIWITHAIFHPNPATWTDLKEPMGDEVWPFFIFASFLWPWAFPIALVVATRLGGTFFGLSYFATVATLWVGGTLSFTYLTFQRWFFFVAK